MRHILRISLSIKIRLRELWQLTINMIYGSVAQSLIERVSAAWAVPFNINNDNNNNNHLLQH